MDDDVVENFFGLLESELLYLQKFESLEHFEQEIIEDLDYYIYQGKVEGLAAYDLQTTSPFSAETISLFISCLTFWGTLGPYPSCFYMSS